MRAPNDGQLLGWQQGRDAAYVVADGLVVALALMAAAAGSGRRAASIYSRPSALCAVAVLVALASASAGSSPAGALHLLAILALPLLAQHRLGYAVFQLACLLNAHCAWGSTHGALWQRSTAAAAHAALMVASLGEQGTGVLHAILNKVFFVQEIQLVRLSKLRALTLADVWQLPKRFRLAAVRQEFVYNVNEPQFLLRAMARMVWQPALLQVALQLLAYMVDIIKPAAQSSLLYYLYASSDHPWYYGYVAAAGMLVVDLAAARLDIFRKYADAEMARASSALELELFRLPLTRNNERMFQTAPKQASDISTLIGGLKFAISLVSDIIGLVASLAALYCKVGWLAAIPVAANGAITLVVWGFSKVAGPSDRWSLYTGDRQNNNTDEIYRGIRTIKLFGWERMYLDPRLQQQAATSDKLPWYAPAVCAIWAALDMLELVSLEASSYLMLHMYTMSHASATGIVAVTGLFQLNSQGISLSAAAGELVAVIGETGSGKSSLLLAVCGELEMTKGRGKVTGRVAYLEQSPWIMNDTMRANILFGREYDAELFGQVIHACALTEDIARWPDADLTVIGERGVNISGGQRARLALARTLYSRADIYVLDDPLSAVDAHVKRHILDHVLLGPGMLAGKLRIIATNSGHILPYAHHVVTLQDGQAAATQQTPQT
ncbi:ATP-binding cassette glutathione S-conjugate transporter ycf1, partial [Coemansia biformis]